MEVFFEFFIEIFLFEISSFILIRNLSNMPTNLIKKSNAPALLILTLSIFAIANSQSAIYQFFRWAIPLVTFFGSKENKKKYFNWIEKEIFYYLLQILIYQTIYYFTTKKYVFFGKTTKRKFWQFRTKREDLKLSLLGREMQEFSLLAPGKYSILNPSFQTNREIELSKTKVNFFLSNKKNKIPLKIALKLSSASTSDKIFEAELLGSFLYNVSSHHDKISCKIDTQVTFGNFTPKEFIQIICFIKRIFPIKEKTKYIKKILNIGDAFNWELQTLSNENRLLVEIATTLIDISELVLIENMVQDYSKKFIKTLKLIIRELKSKNCTILITGSNSKLAELLGEEIFLISSRSLELKGDLQNIQQELKLGYNFEIGN